MLRILFALALFVFAPLPTAQAFTPPPDSIAAPARGPLTVFIDCETWQCDFDFFREEIQFVSYVRTRQDAAVHVLVTAQQSGGGGTRFTLNYIGRGRFAGQDQTLTYTSNRTASEAEVRRALTRTLQAGLIRYAAQTPLLPQLQITYEGPPASQLATTTAPDPWNLWVFETSIGGSMNGEQRTRARSLRGSIEANRTSRRWKIDLEARGSVRTREFETSDTTTVTDTRRSTSFDGLVVRSLSPHWSFGGFAEADRSTFNNYNLAMEVAPALEYNLFPYSSATRKQLRFLYRVGVNRFNYRQPTIFNKTEQTLLQQSLNVTLDVEQPWGSVHTSVWGSNYLHDWSKNRLGLYSDLELNLFRGLSVELTSSISYIRDQLNLPRGEADQQDVLLQRRLLATNYEYYVSVGFSYSFGSTSNSIVNPRFGD